MWHERTISLRPILFTCIHLADAFIQSDLQTRTIEAIEPTTEQQYTSAVTSLVILTQNTQQGFYYIINTKKTDRIHKD